jgi:hypothetical protein
MQTVWETSLKIKLLEQKIVMETKMSHPLAEPANLEGKGFVGI